MGDAESRRRDKIVALGEIGLDYHYETYGELPLDRAKEMAFFEAQLELAEALDLPVIIHDREAHGDCFEAVLRHPGVRGVFHSYSGSAEMAHELVRRGWYISFSGTLTFGNAARVREAAGAVPRDRLLVETMPRTWHRIPKGGTSTTPDCWSTRSARWRKSGGAPHRKRLE